MSTLLEQSSRGSHKFILIVPNTHSKDKLNNRRLQVCTTTLLFEVNYYCLTGQTANLQK